MKIRHSDEFGNNVWPDVRGKRRHFMPIAFHVVSDQNTARGCNSDNQLCRLLLLRLQQDKTNEPPDSLTVFGVRMCENIH